MDRKAFPSALSAALPAALPVMFGFFPMGVAFGLLMDTAGYGALWSFLTSLTVYAGSAQFLGVELLACAAPLLRVAGMTLLINFRHLVYGLSLLERFRGMGGRKLFMIFALPDETYAILSDPHVPEGIEEKDYCFAVALLNYLSWVSGSLLGGLLGAALPINTQGADFAMTALFVVIAVSQWEEKRNRPSALLGFGAAALALCLFGPDRFLIPALTAIVVCLLALGVKKPGHGKGAAA